jgi:tetratricopeptide (TPR) repeat protein
MGRIIPFPESPDYRHGLKKASRKSRVNLEDYGQLNLFQQQPEARVISMSQEENPFESALLLEEEGDLLNARRFYEKCISRHQHVADAHCNLGIIANLEKRYAEAINHFTLALKEQPRHLEAHYNLGYIYSDLNNLPLAKLHYELALQIDAGFTSVYYNLALVHMELEEFAEAENRLMQYKSLVDGIDKKQADLLLHEIRNHLISKRYEKQ